MGGSLYLICPQIFYHFTKVFTLRRITRAIVVITIFLALIFAAAALLLKVFPDFVSGTVSQLGQQDKSTQQKEVTTSSSEYLKFEVLHPMPPINSRSITVVTEIPDENTSVISKAAPVFNQTTIKKDRFNIWYKPLEGCNVYQSNEHMVDCANHKIRAKKEFEGLWTKGQL